MKLPGATHTKFMPKPGTRHGCPEAGPPSAKVWHGKSQTTHIAKKIMFFSRAGISKHPYLFMSEVSISFAVAIPYLFF